MGDDERDDPLPGLGEPNDGADSSTDDDPTDLPRDEGEVAGDEDVPLVPPSPSDDEEEERSPPSPWVGHEGLRGPVDLDDRAAHAIAEHLLESVDEWRLDAKGEQLHDDRPDGHLLDPEDQRWLWSDPRDGRQYVIDGDGKIRKTFEEYNHGIARGMVYSAIGGIFSALKRLLLRTGAPVWMVYTAIIGGFVALGFVFAFLLNNAFGDDPETGPGASPTPSAEQQAPSEADGSPDREPSSTGDGQSSAQPANQEDVASGSAVDDAPSGTAASDANEGSQPIVTDTQDATPETVAALFVDVAGETTFTLTADFRADGDNPACTTYVPVIELRFDGATGGFWTFDAERDAGQQGRPFMLEETSFVVDHASEGPAGAVHETYSFDAVEGRGVGEVEFVDVGASCGYEILGQTLVRGDPRRPRLSVNYKH